MFWLIALFQRDHRYRHQPGVFLDVLRRLVGIVQQCDHNNDTRTDHKAQQCSQQDAFGLVRADRHRRHQCGGHDGGLVRCHLFGNVVPHHGSILIGDVCCFLRRLRCHGDLQHPGVGGIGHREHPIQLVVGIGQVQVGDHLLLYLPHMKDLDIVIGQSRADL